MASAEEQTHRLCAIPRRQSGFSLIELMMTIAVGAVLTVIAVPSFNEFVANNRMTATTNELAVHINIARGLAITRNVPVSICASADGSICGASTRWDTGWIVFSDNSGVVGEVDGTDEILRTYIDPIAKVNILGSGTFLRFSPTGAMIN